MSPLKRFLLIVALTAMWSPSFLFIKLAVQDLPPFTVVALRVGLASVALLAVLWWCRTSLPRPFSFWKHAAATAVFSSALPFSLFCYGEQMIDSALAAILNGTTPMFTALLAHRFVAGDSLTGQKALGVAMGFCGLLLLCAPTALQGQIPDLLGVGAVALASFSYAVGHILAKKYLTGQAPFVAPTAQMLMSVLMIAPMALLWEMPWQLPAPSLLAISGVVGLAICGTLLAFIIYYRLMEECGPTAVSMVACFFPVGGMLLGFLFLGESMGSSALAASALILLGMLIVNNVIKIPALASADRPPA